MNQTALKMNDTDKVVKSHANLEKFAGELRGFLHSKKSVVLTDFSISARLAGEIVANEGGWNQENRRLVEIFVQKYKRDMDRGDWQPNSTIILGLFDDATVLLGDGQHRLVAQSRSGKSQKYILKLYRDRQDFSDAVTTVDAGKARSLSDLATILGLTTGSAQAFERTVNAMQMFHGDKPSRNTNQERLKFAAQYTRSLQYVHSLRTREFKAHLLAAIALAHAREPKVVEALIADVIRKSGLVDGSPAHALVQNLADMNAAPNWAAKQHAMVAVLRVCNDSRLRRTKSVVSRMRANAPHTFGAIAYFTNDSIATAYAGSKK